jgi:hypothetical protein
VRYTKAYPRKVFFASPTYDFKKALVYTPAMLARVFSCAVVGLEGVVIEVEVDYTNGLPGMTIVGLPDAAV